VGEFFLSHFTVFTYNFSTHSPDGTTFDVASAKLVKPLVIVNCVVYNNEEVNTRVRSLSYVDNRGYHSDKSQTSHFTLVSLDFANRSVCIKLLCLAISHSCCCHRMMDGILHCFVSCRPSVLNLCVSRSIYYANFCGLLGLSAAKQNQPLIN